MLTKYKATAYGLPQIVKLDIHHESDYHVFLYSVGKNRYKKERKLSDNQAYTNTFDEAKQFLLKTIEVKIRHAESDLKMYKSHMEQAKQLQETQCTP